MQIITGYAGGLLREFPQDGNAVDHEAERLSVIPESLPFCHREKKIDLGSPPINFACEAPPKACFGLAQFRTPPGRGEAFGHDAREGDEGAARAQFGAFAGRKNRTGAGAFIRIDHINVGPLESLQPPDQRSREGVAPVGEAPRCIEMDPRRQVLDGNEAPRMSSAGKPRVEDRDSFVHAVLQRLSATTGLEAHLTVPAL